MRPKLVHCVGEIDSGLPGNDVGNPSLPEHRQVALCRSLTHYTDKVVATQITISPSQFAERIQRDGRGYLPRAFTS